MLGGIQLELVGRYSFVYATLGQKNTGLNSVGIGGQLGGFQETKVPGTGAPHHTRLYRYR